MLTFEDGFRGRAHAPHAQTTLRNEIITATPPAHNDYPDDVPESTKAHHWVILLAALRRGPVTTLMAREELGVQGVAQRIMDLRGMGYQIITRRLWEEDSAGRRHRIGQYVLIGGAA